MHVEGCPVHVHPRYGARDRRVPETRLRLQSEHHHRSVREDIWPEHARTDRLTDPAARDELCVDDLSQSTFGIVDAGIAGGMLGTGIMCAPSVFGVRSPRGALRICLQSVCLQKLPAERIDGWRA